MASTSVTLQDFTAGKTTQEITRTIRLKLETSQRKNERVQSVIDEWQTMAARAAELMPTVERYRWGDTQSNWINRLSQREFPTEELDILAKQRYEAFYKVSEMFGSWKERGCPGNRPDPTSENYMRFYYNDIEVHSNDRGFGLKVKLRPRDAEWFHINAGAYQRQYLEEIVSGELDTGSAELHLHDDGSLYCHLTVKRDVDVYEPDDVNTAIGVDIGERVLYATAVVTPSGVVPGNIESGREFRHHRDRLEEKRKQLSEQNDLRGVRACKGERERYTDHVLHRASKEIVALAADHKPSKIVIEDLTDYRETAEDPIHDWPFASLQEKIAYKAVEEGIPVEMVDPFASSITCRQCGDTNPQFRDGDDFECWNCGYEVHADFNAAINIAQRGLA